MSGGAGTTSAGPRGTALLLVDVVNDFDFDGGDALLRSARKLAGPLARLKARALRLGLPVLYVNDNWGRWRSDFGATVQHCSGDGAKGHAFVRALTPSEDDYFVLKPANSGFYWTALQPLLRDLGVGTLILTGLTTDNCVLFTAHDAYLHGYRLFVPRDCCAAITEARHARALQIIGTTMKADTRPSARLRLTRGR